MTHNLVIHVNNSLCNLIDTNYNIYPLGDFIWNNCIPLPILYYLSDLLDIRVVKIDRKY